MGTRKTKRSKKAKRTMHMQSLYLEPENAELLDKLSEQSKIPKAVLLREGVEDLLVRYKVKEPAKGGKSTK
jgi:hypothetical protein